MTNKKTKKTSVDPWAIRIAQLINRFGAVKTSVLFVILTLIFTFSGTYFLRMFLSDQAHTEDFLIAIVLTLLSAPWVLWVFSELVKQLERSRESLADAVTELERLRKEDELLNHTLQNNIKQLNHEIEQRKNAQLERESVFSDLEREITDRAEKEQQALRLSTLLRSIIDASPDLIYYRNQEGQFAGCNRVAEEMTGKTEQELIGLTPHQVYDEELARQVVASDQDVLENNTSITEELWLRFADGRRRFYEMRKVPFYSADDTRLGILAFGRDITERKQAENVVAKASKDKTAFIATISHELRTPLNGIVGLSRMLRDTDLTSEQFAWVSTIYASGITLGNIFNDIIDLDRLDRDRLELSLKTVSIKDFTQELSSIIELLADDKDLTFAAHVEEPLPALVEVDGTRLRQILWNLLFNAVKFTQRGTVSLEVKAEKVDAETSMVTFKVCDTGVGIPQQDLDKIFAMYYQVDSPEHQSATGTGIGLAICQQMVSLMNGKISVSSVIGEGTCFTVDLPLGISKKPIQVETLKVTGLQILLVEDIELNVMVAKALLEKLGQHVDVAMTGNEAINMARNKQYDLVLLDIQLPDMNGFEVANVLHEESLVEQTSIVALTANVIKTRQEYLDNGMDEVISKPVKKSRIIEVFNSLFCEQPSVPHQPAPEPKIDPLNTVLDLDLLQMLVDTIGHEMVRTSVKVFQEKMPEYLEILQLSLSADEKDEVCSQAHKIKGAASSVGLYRVQKIANEIQQGDHPAWWQNVHDWVEQLHQAANQDMQKLINWLGQQDIDD
ncbi:aerobic respiration two-component sensor histidine kinase ArcB [Paraglaciecola psychrophila]|uniref:Aerobic respiration control sensor protein n=1 Tax=Paraglaciecola psychrophila 170 TaxID=1129794 RepID=K6Z2W9_9ALTE|nr:aerobic respiration two-component sensor histidine kinase ArcB [Paraglaciecola psychrophila]AGH47201.1 aerobic respiration control sensor protein ArcB [Paraglaciecola psychrophila 170]GAC39394.1 two-component system, OmpR family, aerobic respiration control sensor histidine kinase ArcB [Paraglaciecola psychrophila 170]